MLLSSDELNDELFQEKHLSTTLDKAELENLDHDIDTAAEAKPEARSSRTRHKIDPRPASALKRKEGRKVMMPPTTEPPLEPSDNTAESKAFEGRNSRAYPDSCDSVGEKGQSESGYGMSGALPESNQSRARALARQREIQMRKRQQSMQSGAMMRGAKGMVPNGQFTPGVAQFSAPRAIDDDPYGPFGDRRQGTSRDGWRSGATLASLSMGAPNASREPDYGMSPTHLVGSENRTPSSSRSGRFAEDRSHNVGADPYGAQYQLDNSRPQTAGSVYSDDPQRYDRQLTASPPNNRAVPQQDENNKWRKPTDSLQQIDGYSDDGNQQDQRRGSGLSLEYQTYDDRRDAPTNGDYWREGRQDERAHGYENQKGRDQPHREGSQRLNRERGQRYDGEDNQRYNGGGTRRDDSEVNREYDREGSRRYDGEISQRYEAEGRHRYDGARKQRYDGEGSGRYDGDWSQRYDDEGSRRFDDEGSRRYDGEESRRYDGEERRCYDDEASRRYDGEESRRYDRGGSRRYDGEGSRRYDADVIHRYERDGKLQSERESGRTYGGREENQYQRSDYWQRRNDVNNRQYASHDNTGSYRREDTNGRSVPGTRREEYDNRYRGRPTDDMDEYYDRRRDEREYHQDIGMQSNESVRADGRRYNDDHRDERMSKARDMRGSNGEYDEPGNLPERARNLDYVSEQASASIDSLRAVKAEPPAPDFDVNALPLHDMRSFLTEPCPKAAGIVQCYIRRNRSGTNKFFPEYTVYLKHGDRFLMCSKKRPNNKTSNYLISMGAMRRRSAPCEPDHIIGKIVVIPCLRIRAALRLRCCRRERPQAQFAQLHRKATRQFCRDRIPNL